MKKGFTLIELLVVVLIIGILSAVALPQYNKAVARARMVEFMLQGENLRREVILYELANGERPNPVTDELEIWDRVNGQKAYIGNRKWFLTSEYVETEIVLPGIDNLDCIIYVKHQSYYDATWCYSHTDKGADFLKGLGWRKLAEQTGENARIQWEPPFSWTKR